MLTPTPHSSRVIFVALTVFLASGIAFTQEDPNRPPWAQKSKAKAKSSSSTTSSASTSSPGSPSGGEPGEEVLALEVVLEEDLALALDFCAQGGQLGSSCVKE